MLSMYYVRNGEPLTAGRNVTAGHWLKFYDPSSVSKFSKHFRKNSGNLERIGREDIFACFLVFTLNFGRK